MSRTEDQKTSFKKKFGYPCRHCSQILATSWARSEHELIHIQMSIQCSDCDKSFSNHGNLSRHRKAKHSPLASDSEEKVETRSTTVDKCVGTLYCINGEKLCCGECQQEYELGQETEYWQHISAHNIM